VVDLIERMVHFGCHPVNIPGHPAAAMLKISRHAMAVAGAAAATARGGSNQLTQWQRQGVPVFTPYLCISSLCAAFQYF